MSAAYFPVHGLARLRTCAWATLGCFALVGFVHFVAYFFMFTALDMADVGGGLPAGPLLLALYPGALPAYSGRLRPDHAAQGPCHFHGGAGRAADRVVEVVVCDRVRVGLHHVDTAEPAEPVPDSPGSVPGLPDGVHRSGVLRAGGAGLHRRLRYRHARRLAGAPEQERHRFRQAPGPPGRQAAGGHRPHHAGGGGPPRRRPRARPGW